MVRVKLKNGETQQKLYSRFRRAVNRAGVLGEVRKRKYFISRTEQRRLARKKTIRKKQRDLARRRSNSKRR